LVDREDSDTLSTSVRKVRIFFTTAGSHSEAFGKQVGDSTFAFPLLLRYIWSSLCSFFFVFLFGSLYLFFIVKVASGFYSFQNPAVEQKACRWFSMCARKMWRRLAGCEAGSAAGETQQCSVGAAAVSPSRATQCEGELAQGWRSFFLQASRVRVKAFRLVQSCSSKR
jgi:hypothetical protein